jgi:hypothetical protein
MKKMLLSIAMLFAINIAFTQNIGIGTTTPNTSAVLDITATNKGILPPRVALLSITDVATIAAPATGLLVFNTATAGTIPNNVIPGYYYFTGQKWLRISNGGNAPGDLQYWNGTQWVILPAGITGQNLTICNGVPTWGPCGTVIAVLPTVVTNVITNVGATTASAGGNVTADGGATVTARGVCFSKTLNPTTADSLVINGAGGIGSYNASLTQLAPLTVYHIRAYATNSVGTAYGSDSSFTTSALTTPIITTNTAFGIGATSASISCTVTSNGGSPLTARGVVYSLTPNASLDNSVITDGGISTGSFTATLPGLTANTQYYVRGYATNTLGTSYGNEITLTTLGNGFFAATYTFDSVKTTSGLTDPSPLPTVNGISFGAFSGVGAGAPTANSTAAFRFSLTDWSTGATNGSDVFTSVADTTTKYFEVTITPNVGVTLNLSSVSFKWQRSGTGVRQSFVRSSVDGYTNNLTASIAPANAALSVAATNKFQITDATTTGTTGCTITLGGASFSSITTPITFRFYGINAEAVGGTCSIDDVVFSGSVQ